MNSKPTTEVALADSLSSLAAEVCEFYERLAAARGMGSNNGLLLGECYGCSRVFQIEAAARGYGAVSLARVVIAPKQHHKRKLRILAANFKKHMPGAPTPVDHAWNIVEGFVVDLTARQFGFEGAPFHVGATSFLDGIKLEEFNDPETAALTERVVQEDDLPEFRSWIESGRDWSQFHAWDGAKKQMRALALLPSGLLGPG